MDLEETDIVQFEEIVTNDNNDMEKEQYKKENDVFEIEDTFYEFPFGHSDDEDFFSNGESGSMIDDMVENMFDK